jgi:aminoglycoside phosphotransferase (APT) family kinase protein
MNVDGYLEQYLKSEIFPQLSPPPYGTIDATRISHGRPVYLYHEGARHIKIVGKYHKYDFIAPEEAWHKAEREYSHLRLLRDQVGMKNNHYNVIAPLGINKVLSCLLILEKAPGETLDHYIAGAISDNQSKELFFKLSDLARFFARLHRNSDSGRPVPGKLPQWYLDTVLGNLKDTLSGFYNHETEVRSGAQNWWNREGMWSDHEVIVHGDATPTNFLFHHQNVTGIDLEKMKLADRCWDLGFMAAELKHHHMWRAGDGARAEPYIGHFLWEYGVAFGDTRIFYNVTRRLPFYMALGLLRIARNTWLTEKYRHKLIGEAKLCLKYRP